MEAQETKLKLSDEAFDQMREDADNVLQKMINSMVEKGSSEGKLSINIIVNLKEDSIFRQDEPGTTRIAIKPSFSHKISSVLQVKDEKHGAMNYESKELVFDDEIGEWVIKPITGEKQMNIFDVDFTEVKEDNTVPEDIPLIGTKAVEIEPPVEEENNDTFEEPLEF